MSKFHTAAILLFIAVFAVSSHAQTCKEKCAGQTIFEHDFLCTLNCKMNERLPVGKRGRAVTAGSDEFNAEVFYDNANKDFEECKNTVFNRANPVRNHKCRCSRKALNQINCFVRSQNGISELSIKYNFDGRKMTLLRFQ